MEKSINAYNTKYESNEQEAIAIAWTKFLTGQQADLHVSYAGVPQRHTAANFALIRVPDNHQHFWRIYQRRIWERQDESFSLSDFELIGFYSEVDYTFYTLSSRFNNDGFTIPKPYRLAKVDLDALIDKENAELGQRVSEDIQAKLSRFKQQLDMIAIPSDQYTDHGGIKLKFVSQLYRQLAVKAGFDGANPSFESGLIGDYYYRYQFTKGNLIANITKQLTDIQPYIRIDPHYAGLEATHDFYRWLVDKPAAMQAALDDLKQRSSVRILTCQLALGLLIETFIKQFDQRFNGSLGTMLSAWQKVMIGDDKTVKVTLENNTSAHIVVDWLHSPQRYLSTQSTGIRIDLESPANSTIVTQPTGKADCQALKKFWDLGQLPFGKINSINHGHKQYFNRQ